MHSDSNLAVIAAVMMPLNIAAAIFCAMVCFERAMDWLDSDDDDHTPRSV